MPWVARSSSTWVSVVELVDRAALGSRELDGPGEDRGEDGREIERRVDGLADRPQRRQLLDRASQLVGPCPYLLRGQARTISSGLSIETAILDVRR